MSRIVRFVLVGLAVTIISSLSAPVLGAPPPSPSPSPSSEPSPSPSPSPSKDGEPSAEPSEDATPRPDESTPAHSTPTADPGTRSPSPTGSPQEQGAKHGSEELGGMPAPLAPSAYGSGPFDNSALVAVAERLRKFGRSEDFIMRRVFAPFIIGGPAHWTNSWGALRFDPDGTIRRHLGQDVFCNMGDPVLAAERGVVEFASDHLGGLVARLHREDGGYFYYAHLERWNTQGFSSGDRVVPGDVIGYCGNSGNASGSAPHVHFGYYASEAQDPMGFLLDWEGRAESRSRRAFGGAHAGADALTFARRFGDELVPGADAISGDVVSESIEVLVDAAVDLDQPSNRTVSGDLVGGPSVRNRIDR